MPSTRLTGAWLGTLEDGNGQPLVTEGLWALTFGNGGNGGDSNTLYSLPAFPAALPSKTMASSQYQSGQAGSNNLSPA